MGMNGAMFQMLAHGISSAGMFFMVGVIYERVHHRNLDQFGGLFARMPVYSGLAFGIFFAGLGLPGLCGFIGEVFVTLSAWKFSMALAIDLGRRGDPDRRLHPVDVAAGLPGARIQRPARRPFASDDRPRTGDRRAAVGVCHFVRRLSAVDLQLRDAQRERRKSWP